MTTSVPSALRRWFVVHFVADLIFAIPLVVAPVATLRAIGWTTVDPVAPRLVGAALTAIGIATPLVLKYPSLPQFSQ